MRPALSSLLLLLCLLALPGWAAPLQLTENGEAQPLYGVADYLADPEGRLQLDELIAHPESFSSSATRRDLGFGYVTGAIWLRLEVQSTLDRPGRWRLEVDYPSLDLVQLFDVGSDGIRLSQGGDMVVYEQRSVGNRTPVFDLHLDPGERRTLYLRASSAGSMTLSASLYGLAEHEQHSIRGYVVQAIYFGALLALGSYNLLLFIALRERPFIYYVLFVSTFCIGLLGLNGLGAQLLWTGAGWWTNRALPFGICAAGAIALLFARSFLDTRQWLPRWDRFLGRWFAVIFTCAIATLLLPVPLALKTMSISGVSVCVVLLSVAFVSVRNRVPGAAFFALAWTMLLCGAALLALRNFALIPSNFFTLHAMQIGSMLEMILLSFALAARFNAHKRLREESLQAQERRLEQRVAERTEELAAANQRLQALALQDPLTGIANRNALQQHLEMALRRAQRSGDLLAVMLIDLDGFKPINDQHGHALGDQVLEQVAQRLQSSVRDCDLPARLGGDEFVVVCEELTGEQDAREMAERILAQIGQPIATPQGEVRVGASIGIALSHGEDSATLLLRQADMAMYQAKAEGRNGVRVDQNA
ncbi:diguanylate cyclase domain-containing protein [Aquipseudomonas alcaligenes]|uniref:diguanylate cyclase domain-containing protein n=1 Tax=Aquipseudomonas alcaligenes TaxID=43263 RepID=UPI00374A69E0